MVHVSTLDGEIAIATNIKILGSIGHEQRSSHTDLTVVAVEPSSSVWERLVTLVTGITLLFGLRGLRGGQSERKLKGDAPEEEAIGLVREEISKTSSR